MRSRAVFALAIVLGAVLAVAAAGGAVSRRDRPGLPMADLLRVEELPENPATPIDTEIRYLLRLVAGEIRVTDEDFATRFHPSWAQNFAVDDINAFADILIANNGSSEFVRFRHREPFGATMLVVGEDGGVGLIFVEMENDQIVLFTAGPDETNPRRLAAWEAVLLVLAGSVLLGAAVAASRYRAVRDAWLLAAAGIVTMAGIMVLSNTSAVYTAGRVLPAVAVLPATALLLAPTSGRWSRWVLGAAAAASVAGALAPFFRDAGRIGHPTVVGAVADDEAIFRALLVVSAGLTFVALSGVVMVNLGRLRQASGRLRPAILTAISIAAIWAAVALGAAGDYAGGDATLASNPFRAIALSALAVVPAAVIFRLVVSRWERPELAALVIDLEGESTDLQPAIAKALDDPTLQVLTSPDGRQLVDDRGRSLSADDLPEGQVLTRIQSGDRLVGGIVHTADLQSDPDRLEAVAAAAGMAVQLDHLNRQVVSQLDEVNASRARILQASDSARRQVERDLHDGAQQRLVAHGLRLQRARRLAGAYDHLELVGLLEEATGEVRDTIDEIRAVSRGRQPSLLAERGLATAVDALAERAPVPVDLDVCADQLPESVERTAYFVVAEGLTNMAKHAKATKAQVSITHDLGAASITIQDDGTGGAKISPGSGLEGLNDRLAATGGTFDISSGPEGTTLKATIPCA